MYRSHSLCQRAALLGCVLLLSFIAATPVRAAEPPPDLRKESEGARTVRKLLGDQVDAWNQGDLKGFMAGYWNSPDLSFYSGRDTQKGWQATYERYKKRYQSEGKEMGQLSFSELLFDPLSTDTMLVRGRWKLKLAKGDADGLFSLIVKKKTEGWRVVHDHTSIGEPEKKQP